MQFNTDITEDLNLDAIVGWNLRVNQWDIVGASTNGGLNFPNIYSLDNSVNPLTSDNTSNYDATKKVDGIYARVSFGYQNTYYLEGTFRRDRSSTLPIANNTYTYPSVSGSVILSNLIEAPWLSFAKVRANFAQVGNDVGPYRTLTSYIINAGFGGQASSTNPSTFNNSNLVAEKTDETEFGVEVDLFNSRVGLDISVYDKTGIIEFAKGLDALGYELVSTGGTARKLREAGLDVIGVSDVTGHPEIFDGRVKSLHPAIHGPLLCRLEKEQDAKGLEELGYPMIEIVACNLYPFSDAAAIKPPLDDLELLEMVDIGGPTMVRASAKNHRNVIITCNPEDYSSVISDLKSGQVSMEKVIDQVPNVAGLKHSAANQAMIPIFSNMGLACFSGNGFLPLPSLSLGAVGTVDAPLSIIPSVYNELYKAWVSGNIELAQEKQREVTRKVGVLKSYNSAADASKTLLSEILEIDCGRSILPNRRLSDSETSELITKAKKEGLI